MGNGTEYGRVERYVGKYKPENIALRQWIPKEEYNRVVVACDEGMIFLDDRFTIPNFPSRLLSYMAAKLPVLAVTDIGKVITEGGFGWWCGSGDVKGFASICEKLQDKESLVCMGDNAKKYLEGHYSVRQGYESIMRKMQ